MRKSKEIKRKRREAASEYKKRNRADAYKKWREAKVELDALRGTGKAAAPSAAAPSETKSE